MGKNCIRKFYGNLVQIPTNFNIFFLNFEFKHFYRKILGGTFIKHLIKEGNPISKYLLC